MESVYKRVQNVVTTLLLSRLKQKPLEETIEYIDKEDVVDMTSPILSRRE